MGALLPWSVVVGSAAVAALTDIRSRRIPNALTLPVLAAGLVWALASGGLGGLGSSVLGVLVLAAPFVLLFLAGGGAGDAKLMGALGAWLGLAQGVPVLVCVCIAGGVLGILWAARARTLRANLGGVATLARAGAVATFGRGGLEALAAGAPDPRAATRMPYGLAILAGVLAALFLEAPWHA